ncbi:MAG: hypothetical protein ABI183_10475 [Polyangiaceae bacterium]
MSVEVAAGIFGLYVLYKFRPFFGEAGSGAGRGDLREARLRLTKATNDAERLDALLAAGDACARTVGLGGGASSYYFRAMRLAPANDEVIVHAARNLERRPRILETLLWRRLGTEPWTGEHTKATRAALRQLISIYTTKRRSALRARAMERALAALEATDTKSPEKQAEREITPPATSPDSPPGSLKH